MEEPSPTRQGPKKAQPPPVRPRTKSATPSPRVSLDSATVTQPSPVVATSDRGAVDASPPSVANASGAGAAEPAGGGKETQLPPESVGADAPAPEAPATAENVKVPSEAQPPVLISQETGETTADPAPEAAAPGDTAPPVELSVATAPSPASNPFGDPPATDVASQNADLDPFAAADPFAATPVDSSAPTPGTPSANPFDAVSAIPRAVSDDRQPRCASAPVVSTLGGGGNSPSPTRPLRRPPRPGKAGTAVVPPAQPTRPPLPPNLRSGSGSESVEEAASGAGAAVQGGAESDAAGAAEKQRLFEALYVFTLPPTGKVTPKLALQYPPPPDGRSEKQLKRDAHELDTLANLCFPYDEKSDAAITSQEFTFYFLGGGLYGFCKQIAPATPASNAECLCMTTRMAWHTFFPLLLRHLSKSGSQSKLVALLKELESVDPDRAGTVVDLPPGPGGRKPFSMALPPKEHALPEVDASRPLQTLVDSLSTTNILTLFAAALFDRRIIVTSSRLSSITGVIFGIIELLYPLTWEHTLIPVMSEDLLDYCTAPMPYIMGVHSSLIGRVLQEPLESHVFVDIDADKVANPEADYQLIPLDLVGHIRAALNKAKKDPRARGDQLAAACLRFFVDALGDCTRFTRELKPRGGNKAGAEGVVLDVDFFVASKKKEHRAFYAELVQMQSPTQFFDQRFDAIAQGTEIDDLFSRAVAEKAAKRAHVRGLGGSSPQPRRRTIAKIDTSRPASMREVSVSAPPRGTRAETLAAGRPPRNPRPATVAEGADVPAPVAPPRRRRKSKSSAPSAAGSAAASAQTSPRGSEAGSPEPRASPEQAGAQAASTSPQTSPEVALGEAVAAALTREESEEGEKASEEGEGSVAGSPDASMDAAVEEVP